MAQNEKEFIIPDLDQTYVYVGAAETKIKFTIIVNTWKLMIKNALHSISLNFNDFTKTKRR